MHVKVTVDDLILLPTRLVEGKTHFCILTSSGRRPICAGLHVTPAAQADFRSRYVSEMMQS